MKRSIRIWILVSFLSSLLGFPVVSVSQTNTLSGVIWDQVNKIPISYTSIALIQKNSGTTSAVDGKFTINIDTSIINDTIAFSCVGYQTKRKSIRELIEKNNSIIFLVEKPIELQTVTISTIKGKTPKHRKTFTLNDVKYKITKVKRFLVSNGYSSQMAVLYKVNAKIKKNCYIDKIRITLSSGVSTQQAMKFNLRLYTYDSINNLPGVELYNKPIIVNAQDNTIKEVNLRDFRIRIPDEYFFVSVEWLLIEENIFVFTKGKKSRFTLYLPIIPELKESKDIIGVWDFNFNQKWRKREDLNGSKSSLDISVILRD